MIRSSYKLTLAAFLGRDSAEVLLDQLDELYELRIHSEGATKAKLWYCYQVLVGLLPVLRFWLSERLFVSANAVGHPAVAFVSDKAPSGPYPKRGVVIGVLTLLLTILLVIVPTRSKPPTVPNSDSTQHTKDIVDQPAGPVVDVPLVGDVDGDGKRSQHPGRVTRESTYLQELASAEKALNSGKTAQAEKILSRILKSNPDDEKARDMLNHVMEVRSAERKNEE